MRPVYKSGGNPQNKNPENVSELLVENLLSTNIPDHKTLIYGYTMFH